MKNAMVMVSGVPGTGKTTFATWLSSQLRAPLVCFDRIKEKTLEIMYASCGNPEQYNLFGGVSLGFFWFTAFSLFVDSALLKPATENRPKWRKRLNQLLAKMV